MVATAKKQRSGTTQMDEFRVAMTSICTYNGPIIHYKLQGLDIHILTMGAISESCGIHIEKSTLLATAIAVIWFDIILVLQA